MNKIIQIFSFFLILGSSLNSFSQDSSQTKTNNSQADSLVFINVQTVPEFEGGEKAMYLFIYSNLVYPEEALEMGVSGRVLVEFYVEVDGTVSGVRSKSKKILGFGCEEAAIRVVKKMSGKWKPSYIADKPAKMKMLLPINFNVE